MIIRPPTVAELPGLQDLERRAGAPFRGIAMDEIAADEPPAIATLLEHVRDGHAWVAVEDSGRPVAYLIAGVLDDALHIEQVSVDADWARRGIGGALVHHAAGRAAAEGLAALTLTTFAEVPWTAPYYERLGFRVLGEDELTPGLRAVRAAERERGLDRWPRVAMRRGL